MRYRDDERKVGMMDRNNFVCVTEKLKVLHTPTDMVNWKLLGRAWSHMKVIDLWKGAIDGAQSCARRTAHMSSGICHWSPYVLDHPRALYRPHASFTSSALLAAFILCSISQSLSVSCTSCPAQQSTLLLKTLFPTPCSSPCLYPQSLFPSWRPRALLPSVCAPSPGTESW